MKSARCLFLSMVLLIPSDNTDVSSRCCLASQYRCFFGRVQSRSPPISDVSSFGWRYNIRWFFSDGSLQLVRWTLYCTPSTYCATTDSTIHKLAGAFPSVEPRTCTLIPYLFFCFYDILFSLFWSLSRVDVKKKNSASRDKVFIVYTNCSNELIRQHNVIHLQA